MSGNRNSIECALPLSEEQKLFYFNPKIRNTVIVGRQYYDGEMDLSLLAKVLRELVHVHDILRTVFSRNIFAPRQYLVGADTFDIEIVTSKDLDNKIPAYKALDDHNTRIDALQNIAYKTAFNLSKAPLFKLYAYTDEPGKTVLVIAINHIISDSESLNVFFKDLLRLYANDKPARRELQFGNYLQRINEESRRKDSYKKDYQWHQENLKDNCLYAGLLPNKRVKRNVVKKGDPWGEGIIYALSEPLNDVIAKLCQEYRVSPLVIFITAAGITSYKKMGTEKFLVNALFGNRVLWGSDAIIGCLVKAIFVYFKVSGSSTINQLIKSVNTMYYTGCVRSNLSVFNLFKILFLMAIRHRNKEVVMMSYEPDLFRGDYNSLLSDSTKRVYFDVKELAVSLDMRIGGTAEKRLLINAMYSKRLYSREVIESYFAELEKAIVMMANSPDMSIDKAVGMF